MANSSTGRQSVAEDGGTIGTLGFASSAAVRAAYKVHAGIPAANVDYDTLIDRKILEALAMAERYCGRTFDYFDEWVETKDGTGTPDLVLNNVPITAVASVALLDGTGTSVTLSSTSYRVHSSTGTLRFLSSGVFGWESPFPTHSVPVWPRGVQNVVVTYEGGYTTTVFPADLQNSIYTLVDTLIAQRRQNTIGEAGSTGPGVSSTARSADDIRKMTRELFEPYRVRVR